MAEKLTFRIAIASDRDVIFELLKTAAAWLQARGIDYWQNWHRPPAHHIAWIDDGISAGEFRIAEENASVIGCFRLQDADELFWGPQAEPAGYLHSLTVDRSRAGEGLGRIIIDTVRDDLLSRGVHLLRLDCGARVSGLCRYYEMLGFVPVGTTEVDGETLVLYQKSSRFESFERA